jgi:tetratricopeptide (TPR) repeat protein
MSESFQELFARGYKARQENRVADSRAVFIQGVRSAAEAGDRPSLAEALSGLAQAERDIGNLEAARHHYANAATLYREIGPPKRLAYAIRHEADVLREECRPAEAEPLYQEAASIYRKQGRGGHARPGEYSAGAGFGGRIISQAGCIQSVLAGGTPVVCQVQGGGRRCGV